MPVRLAGVANLDVVKKPGVDLVDQLEVPRQEELEEFDWPLLERLGQEGVVRIGQGAHRQVPGLIPAEMGIVEEDSHQLGDGHGRMSVVELDGHLLGQGLPGITAPLEAAENVSQRAGDEEVLLEEPE